MRLKKVGSLCLLLLLLLSTVAHAKIVFGSKLDGLRGIYVMNDDGSNIMPLTESEELRPTSPTWSPDGQQILFKRLIRDTVREEGVVRVTEGNVLLIMNADGTNIRQLTQNDGSSLNGGSFSPDGTSIVFKRSIEINDTYEVGIYVLNIKTGKIEKISGEWGIQCDWSPDGKHIVFAKPQGVNTNTTIWIMRSDGHNPRRLLPAPGPGEFATYRSRPRWSPDGQQVLFQQKVYRWEPIPDEGNLLVFKAFRYLIYDRNRGNIKQLRIPKDWAGVGRMSWMDEGKSIVFSARASIPLNKPIPRGFVYPPSNIYKYHIQTGEITRLTDHPGTDQMLDWSSDDVLSVSSEGKMQTQWGAIKEFLQSRSEAFKSLSQNVLFFLQNQR